MNTGASPATSEKRRNRAHRLQPAHAELASLRLKFQAFFGSIDVVPGGQIADLHQPRGVQAKVAPSTGVTFERLKHAHPVFAAEQHRVPGNTLVTDPSKCPATTIRRVAPLM